MTNAGDPSTSFNFVSLDPEGLPSDPDSLGTKRGTEGQAEGQDGSLGTRES